MQTMPNVITSESSNSSILRAVGWLERGKPYTRGTVEPAIFNALSQLLKEPWGTLFLHGIP